MRTNLTKKEYEQLLANGWREEEDYVFVSYASADWEKVYPTVLALRARGINVYIDVEFQENQSQNWLENFQRQLLNPCCGGIVAFLSINYMRSYACLMEQLANRTQRLRRKVRGFHPVFYSALEPEMGSIQKIESRIVECRKESFRQTVKVTTEESVVLQDFIADMHKDYGFYSDVDAKKIVKDLNNKHDVATTMLDLIFKNHMPSIQVFDDPESYAELLRRNFVGDKNTTINLEILEDLKAETQQRLREAEYDFVEDSEPAVKEVSTEGLAPVPIQVVEPTPAVETSQSAPTPSAKPATDMEAPQPAPAPIVGPVLVTEAPQPQRRGRGRPPKNTQPVSAPQPEPETAPALEGELPPVTLGEIRQRFLTEEFCLKVQDLRKNKLPYGGKGALDYGMAAILGGCNNIKQPCQINYYNFAIADYTKKTDGKAAATWTWSSNCRKVIGMAGSGQIDDARNAYFAALPEDTTIGQIVNGFERADSEAYRTTKNPLVAQCLRMFAALL